MVLEVLQEPDGDAGLPSTCTGDACSNSGHSRAQIRPELTAGQNA